MSKIIRITAENVKRLRVVQITPQGHLITIGGNNGAGKTSLLDSIGMALSGQEIPEEPVRHGEKGAKILIETEDIVVKRTFTAAGGTSLIVENKEGMRYSSPQTVLDKLTGKLTFDPLSFLRLKPKDQAEALKRLVGLDLTELDAQRQKLYDERTIRNKDLDRVTLLLDMLVVPEKAEAVDTADLMKDLETATTHNAQRAELVTTHAEATEILDDALAGETSLNAEIVKAEKKLKDLRANLADQSAGVDSARKRLDAATLALTEFMTIDDEPIRVKLAGAAETNQKVHDGVIYAEAQAAVELKKKAVDEFTSQIEAIDAEKAKKLTAVKFPIDGLSFSETGVRYSGVPLEQASGADLLRISVAIAAAMNPKLRVMLVRDGSLLDPESLALLGQLAKEHDIQVWIEMVGKGEHVQVVIEDGSVSEVREETPAASVEDNTVPIPFT